MSNIDERVARLELENSQFEKAADETLRTLNQIDKGLELKNADKGIRQLEQSMNGLSFSGLESGVSAIQDRFSALGTFAGRIVEKIADDCYASGKRMVESFTIDPVKSGFQEYETQINAVQTILANTQSKGSTIEDVNAALDDLNLYADKTIYNFTEMTRNIGTFTAAGVGLEDATTAIKGIANLAAVSGSSSQQASTAMYQLSQALASGKVQLQDWNSVVNAGMGGQIFQDALKRTAKNMGMAVDESQSFRESISAKEGTGWLTSEVLLETLKQLSGDIDEATLKSQGYTESEIADILSLGQTAQDAATKVKTFTQLFDTLKEAAQSGWTQSWEIIIGDFEEAKVLLTEVSDTFGGIISDSANARNQLLEHALGDSSGVFANMEMRAQQAKASGEEFSEAFKPMTGRELLIDSIRNALEGLGSVLSTIKGAWESVFPPVAAGQLYTMLNSLHNFSANLKLSEETLQKVGSVFKGVFSIFRLGATVITSLAKGFGTILKALFPLGSGFLDTAASLGDYVSNLVKAEKESGTISSAIGKAADFIAGLVGNLSGAFSKIKDFVLDAGQTIKDFFDKVVGKLQSKLNVVDGAVTHVRGIKDVLAEFRDNSSSILDTIKSKLSSFADKVKEIFEKIKEIMAPVFDKIKEAWSDVTFTDVLGTGLLGGIFTFVKKIIEQKDDLNDNLGKIAGGIKDTLGVAREALESWQTRIKSDLIIKIAIAVGILAVALIALSNIKPEELAAGLAGIAALMTSIVATMTALDKLNVKGQGGNAVAIVVIAAAISILAGALKKLEPFQTWDETWPAVVALLALLGGITAFTAILANTTISSDIITTGAGLFLISMAMDKLAKALVRVADLDTEQIKMGLLTIGGLLAEVAVYATLVDKKKTQNIASVAAGILILYAATKLFGTMDPGILEQGLNSINTLLLMLGAASAISGLTQGSGAGAIMALALAITALIIPIKTFASMFEENAESLREGISIVEELMFVMTAAVGTLSVIGGLGGNLTGAATAMLAVGAALILFATALKILDTVQPETISNGVKAFMIVLLGFAAVTAVLAPFSGILLTVAGAVALLGVGAVMCGVGIMALAAGLATLIGLGSAASGAITMLVVAVATGIALGIPTIVAAVIAGLGLVLQALQGAIPQIGAVITVLLQTILGIIQDVGPALIETIIILIEALLTSIADHLPNFIEQGTRMIMALLDGINNALPDLVSKSVDIVVTFITSLGDALAEKTPELVTAIWHMFEGLIEGFKNAVDELAPDALEKMKQMAIDLIQGLVDGITNGIQKVKDACKKVTDSITGKIKEILQIHSPSKLMRDEVGRPIVEGIAEGITKDTSAEEAAKKKADNIASAFKEEIDKFDMAQSVNDLEYELWSKVNERTATDGQKAGMNMVHLQKNYQLQSQAVKLAQEEYEYTVRELGETSIQATESYKKLLQAQIDLAGMWNDIQDGWDDMKVKTSKGRDYGPGESEEAQGEQEYYDLGYDMGASLDSGFNAYMSDKMSVATDSSGESIGTAFSEGLLATSGVNVDSIGQVMSETLNRVDQERSNWVSTGSNLVAGLAEGIRAGSSAAIDAAVQMASETLAAANAQLGVQSPSKEFMKTGQYAGEGLMMGIEDLTSRVAGRAQSMAQTALDVCQEVMTGINDILTGEDATPVITPVIDLSNVTASAGQMESIFGNRYGATSYTGRLLRSNYDTAESRRTSLAEKASFDSNAGLITEIRALGDRIDDMGNSIGRMKVVMNANAVVGQIEQPMDARLGKTSKYRQRGV